MMESLWSRTAQLPSFPALSGDLEVEAAVIGGGMAGILTARALEQKGVKTAVLEAGRIAGGQTQNTTAKITSQHGMIYAKLTEQLGKEKAGQYARANQNAIRAYKELIGRLDIDCMFREVPAYLYSQAAEDPLREESHAARALGIDAAFTTDTALPFPVAGAVRFRDQAVFHPLKFLAGVARGLTVFEHTRVREVKGQEVETDRGTVRAKHIIFATHFPFVNVPGYYFMRMHQERSYVIALENAPKLDGAYYGVDPGGLSFRNAGDLLLVGGGNHRTGENREGGKYRLLRQEAARLWPEGRETAHWSAQDCMSMDGVPFIGRYASSTPNWYVATGFGKWGMTTSMAAAQILSRLITGEECPDAQVFSPQRFELAASSKNLMEDGKQAVKGLGRAAFAPPRAMLDALPEGHGGVVEADGEKVGVYKDEKGQIFLVSVRCPHLGCQVEWNPDERSWDCPCHGSRFDHLGRLICGPAQEDLDRG